MQSPESQQSSQHGAATVPGAKKRQRVYQHWQGNERFFCSGYLVAGPNWKASIGTALLILAPAGVFLAFVAPYMGLQVHIVLLVISCILPVLSVWFLMLTACRDPGIIPRQEPDQEYLSGVKSRTKEVCVNQQRVVIRYNDTCHFYQPPRAHHCSVNDNCIERFDHHCPWVGTTIGLRNYRTFLLFVYTSTVLCMYVFGVCVAMLFVKHGQLMDDARAAGQRTSGLWPKTLGKCIPALALMGYTFLFFWFVGGLSVFHAYLVGTNQTTYENFRYNHDNRRNPYSRGCFANCAEVWCHPVPPCKVPFRAYIDEFRPPTGQPYSPYLNGQQQQGGMGDGMGGEGGEVGGGTGYGPEVGSSSPTMAPSQGVISSPGQYGAGSYQQAKTSGYVQQGGAIGAGGGGGGGYGGYGQTAYSSGGSATPSALYDPAALHRPVGQQQYGNIVNSRYDVAVDRGDSHSVSYSDAGTGWGGGGGPMNEPPAQVKSYNTFTSPTAPGAVGGVAAGARQGASPRVYGGGGAGYGPGAAGGYLPPGGGGGYYDEQYVTGEEGYVEYDTGAEPARGKMRLAHAGSAGVVRPEHIRPSIAGR